MRDTEIRRGLLFELEIKDRDKIKEIIKYEDTCEVLEGKFFSSEIIRSNNGSYTIYFTKKEGEFSKNELILMENHNRRINREFSITGGDRVGITLDTETDYKPFCPMDNVFGHYKTYKTQSYARAISIGLLEELEEEKMLEPEEEKMEELV